MRAEPGAGPVSALADASAPDLAPRSVGTPNFQNICFSLEDLDGAIVESGLVGEFEVQQEARRKLAAQGLTLISIAIGAVTDDEFEAYLSALEAPSDEGEAAFLFGFCEHLRQQILGAFESDEHDLELGLRSQLLRRLKRAQQLCDGARGAGLAQ